MPQSLVILNPTSGNGSGARLRPEIERALHTGGLDFDIACTDAPFAAIALAEQAKCAGYHTLIAVGGDGTNHEVANGLMRASGGKPTGTLGIIPVGSGNDFVKTLGLPHDWRHAVQKILEGKTRRVDIGTVTCDQPASDGATGAHYFINALDTGFGASAARHAHDLPFLRGLPMYLAAVFKVLVNYSNPRVKITLDDQTIEQVSTMVAVANGRCFGGGFRVAPTAAVDDGMFDVIIADDLGRMGILTLLPKVIKGTHIGDPRVQFKRARRVAIASPDLLIVEADGEIPYTGVHRADIEILHRHLQVIA